MKIRILLLALLACTALKAQDYTYKNYEWDAIPQYRISDDDKKADAVILKDLRATEYIYNDKGSLTTYALVHKAILVNEDKAVEDYNKIYIPAYNSVNLLKFKARTLLPDGTIKEIDKDKIKEIPNLQDAGAFKIVALEGVEKGSIVEYIYIDEEEVEYFGREVYQSDAKVDNGVYTLIYPDNFIFDIKGYNNCPAITEKTKDDKVIRTITFKNIPAAYNERYANYSTYLMRVEYRMDEVSGKGKVFTWQDAADFIMANTYTFSGKEQNMADDFLKKLDIKNKKTESEKIETIEEGVKSQIQLQDASGEDYEMPEKIFASKFANETGFKNLFALLFSQADITHQIVYTSNKSQLVFDPDFSSWNALQHSIFYFPDIDKFLDPESFNFRLGTIPVDYINNYGLFITVKKEGKENIATYDIKEIPGVDVMNHSDNLYADISFPPSMDYAQVNMKRSFAGYNATGIQPYYNLIDADKQKEFKEAMLKSSGKDAVISSMNTENADITSVYNNKPLIVEGNMQISSLLEKAGKKYIFHVGNIIGEQVEMYQDRPRQFDIDMDFPHQYERYITITVPDGYAVKGLSDFTIDHAFKDEKGNPSYGFTCNYTQTGNIVKIHCNEYYNNTHYPKSEFDNFRTVINASADFNKLSLVLEPK